MTASVADTAGNVATANATAALDTSAGITVILPTSMRYNATVAPISGTTTGIEADGQTVTLVVKRCRSGDAGRDGHGAYQPGWQLQHDGDLPV